MARHQNHVTKTERNVTLRRHQRARLADIRHHHWPRIRPELNGSYECGHVIYVVDIALMTIQYTTNMLDQ